MAFENARNVLPLSVKSNMGLSTNLRAFCDGVSELFAHGVYNNEILETATAMKEEGEVVSPGMVKHVQPTAYMQAMVDNFYRVEEVSLEDRRKIYERPVTSVGPVERLGLIREYPENLLSFYGKI